MQSATLQRFTWGIFSSGRTLSGGDFVPEPSATSDTFTNKLANISSTEACSDCLLKALPCIMCVHRGMFSTLGVIKEYIEGISGVHRGMLSTSGGYHE